MGACVKATHSPRVSPEEKALLQEIRASRRFPVANFELRSSKDPSVFSGALQNVHLYSIDDTMEEVVRRGELLERLARKGLVFLNYELRAYVQSDYAPYRESDLFRELEASMKEAKDEGFYFDYAFLKKGLAVLTPRGKYAAR